MIQALILFGSHARGDSEGTSDVDVIAVLEGAPGRPFEKENLSISFYSRKFLIKIASAGNLFALHLAVEAKPIYDPSAILLDIKKSFVGKPDYHKEVADASMLGWFLLRHADKISNPAMFNKRIAWCVRTILIASAYMQGSAIFSARELSDFARNKDAEALILRKNTPSFSEDALFKFARFLRDFGLGDPGIYNVDDINSHIEYIFRSGNLVGKNTINSLFGRELDQYISGGD